MHIKNATNFSLVSKRIKTHVLLCFMNLFLERFMELLLRQNGIFLTPDRIRYALSGVHTMVFENQNTNKIGEMRSALSEDALNIFKVLGDINRSFNIISSIGVVSEFLDLTYLMSVTYKINCQTRDYVSWSDCHRVKFLFMPAILI